MKTYLARLTFSVSVGNDKNSEFDEQIRVIESSSSESALYKARALGKKEEESFTDTQGKTIRWRFIDVSDIYRIDGLSDGSQLYSTSHKVADADSYINYIRNKSMEIQAKNLTFA
jgi:hypothetical protein